MGFWLDIRRSLEFAFLTVFVKLLEVLKETIASYSLVYPYLLIILYSLIKEK